MYQAPHNRALFKKKASAARDKLMEMGGVQKGLGSMQRPSMPGGPSGIMASSPDLMQAAMRKAPVLPTQQGAAPQPAAPAPAPAPTPLPPSQPMPNIAGIAPVPTNQPQPAKPATPAKQPVKKMQEGGAVDLGHYDSPLLREKLQESKPGTTFKDALNTTQKAITSQDPEKLGVPKELQAGMKERKELMEKDPDAAGAAFVDQNLTPEEATGDLKKDLKKVATKSGVTDIPTSATVDQLNQAIAGAKLGAAIAGNYVNPQTGQAVRQTAGARIGQAVAEGLAVKRDTAQKREAAEQAMKLAQAKAAGKSTSNKLPPNMKSMIEIFKERAKTEDLDEVAKDFNEYFGDNTGDQIMTYLKTGMTGGNQQPEITPDQRLAMVKYALQQQPENRQLILDQAKADGVNIEGL